MPTTKYTAQTIGKHPTGLFILKNNQSFVGIGNPDDKSKPNDFLVKGNISLKKIK